MSGWTTGWPSGAPRATSRADPGAAARRRRRTDRSTWRATTTSGCPATRPGRRRPRPRRPGPGAAGAGASRLVTGTLTCTPSSSGARRRPRAASRRWCCRPATHANLAAVTALADGDTLVVSDAHVHASLVDAAGWRAARCGSCRTATSAPSRAALAARRRAAGPGARRVGLLRARRRRPAGRSWPRCAPGTTPCCWSTRPTGSGWPAMPGLGWSPSTGSLGTRGRGHAHAVQVARQPGRRGARHAGGRRAPGQHRPALHLRHRAGAGAGGAALAALDVLRAEPSLAAQVRDRFARAGRRSVGCPPAGAIVPVPMPSPHAAVAAQAAARGRGRPGRLLPAALGARRHLPAAGHGARRLTDTGLGSARRRARPVAKEQQ